MTTEPTSELRRRQEIREDEVPIPGVYLVSSSRRSLVTYLCLAVYRFVPPRPGVDLLMRAVLGVAVPLLELAGELFSVALDLIEVVVGQLAPLHFRLTFNLVP